MTKEMVKLDFIETKRSYYYADGTSISFENVTHFLNSTTTHRLKANGKLYIVKNGWRYIEIEADEFTA